MAAMRPGTGSGNALSTIRSRLPVYRRPALSSMEAAGRAGSAGVAFPGLQAPVRR